MFQKYGADNVGGIVKMIPGKSIVSRAMAGAISSSIGAGNAFYKTGLIEEARVMDTVFGGCYRKEVFSNIGVFDERLA